jgi:hypothetical protein
VLSEAVACRVVAARGVRAGPPGARSYVTVPTHEHLAEKVALRVVDESSQVPRVLADLAHGCFSGAAVLTN